MMRLARLSFRPAAVAVLVGGLVAAGLTISEGHRAAAATATSAHLMVGRSVTDSRGQVWESDSADAIGGKLASTSHPIAAAGADQVLFQSHRYAMTGYQIPLAPGNYEVTLNLSENFWSGPGRRLFNVTAEGRAVVDHLDVFARAGSFHAYRLSFLTTVRDGGLSLGFTSLVDNAMVSSLSVLPARTAPAPTQPAAVRPAPGPATSVTMNVPPPVAVTPPSAAAPAPVALSSSQAPATPTSAVAPVPVTPTSPPAPPVGLGAAAPTTYVTPESFGARGDGVTDDTVALQAAFDRAPAGTSVYLAPGKTYVHSDVLHLRTAGLRVTGAGVLLAVNEARSSVWIEADNVVLDGGVTVKTAHTTTRWSAWEQMGLRIVGHSGATLRNVTIDGSAAAGLYVGDGASHFVLDHVTVQNTRADGIHMTAGANNGQVISPTVVNSGDDGVAVVSYSQDGTPCHDITVSSPRVLGTTGGRGLSVVGGARITETNIDIERSSAAGIYIAAEGNPWFTAAPVDVTVSGGTIVDANTDAGTDHGAVLVVSEENGPTPSNITINGLAIVNTRASASRTFGVVNYGSAPSSVLFENLTVTGGTPVGYGGNAPQSSFATRNIVKNGVLLPNAG